MSSLNPIDLADHDLAALQEARDLLGRAKQAAATLALWTPEEAKRVAKEVAAALLPRAEFYAEWAVRESRIGKVADKIAKNQIACTLTPTAWDNVALGGVRRNDALRIVEIGRPAGVVVGLSNSTSPVATIIFKTILCLMTRNALVISPHPVALGCCTAVTHELQAAIEKAGGPAHALQILTRPTVEATGALMRDARTDVILATGGTPMVRAAYGSGNPAIGVGSGNVPIYVDASADIEASAQTIVTAKNFDHGSPCSAPSVLLLHASIAAQMQQALARQGAHVCTEAEAQKIQNHAFPGGKFNGKVVGRPAFEIAQAAGVQVPQDCQALVCPIANPPAGHVMFKEKLSPILGCVVVPSMDQAIEVARLMLQHSGAGHTSPSARVTRAKARWTATSAPSCWSTGNAWPFRCPVAGPGPWLRVQLCLRPQANCPPSRLNSRPPSCASCRKNSNTFAESPPCPLCAAIFFWTACSHS
jgi:acyl-CoA reductase-like NAD-dependent aldehyde dehydrogenase